MKGTEVGNRIKALSDALSLNVGSISKFSVAMAAAGAAIKVATDAFKANEEMMDEWGRITESSRAIYDGFLNAINTGDVSGYLSRIGEIRKAAREAYDAMTNWAPLTPSTAITSPLPAQVSIRRWQTTELEAQAKTMLRLQWIISKSNLQTVRS